MKCPECGHVFGNNVKIKFESDFNDCWKSYPVKDGKKASIRHWNASINNAQDVMRFRLALSNYLAHLRAETWKKPKSGSTFFNNWEDWVDYKYIPETRKVPELNRPPAFRKDFHVSKAQAEANLREAERRGIKIGFLKKVN